MCEISGDEYKRSKPYVREGIEYVGGEELDYPFVGVAAALEE